MFLYSEEEEIIEKDSRFSKANYSSQKNYSIEIAILEKRIIFNSSMINMQNTNYAFTDLKACYNRQLANLGSIIEESVGRDRNTMIIFTKILLIWQLYVCTNYGISTN